MGGALLRRGGGQIKSVSEGGSVFLYRRRRSGLFSEVEGGDEMSFISLHHCVVHV